MAKIISFQGLPGAYSDLVCRKFYGNHKTLPCSTFEQTLSAVENEQAETALIPVENNLAGRVADMHFLLEKISLKIVAEHYHKIEHHLLAKKNSKVANINNVYSHSHALSQCRNNLKKFNLNPVHFIDTAGAAKFVSESEDASLAAIASELSSSIYKLRILKRNFEDKKNNVTRFLVFSKKSKKISTDKKVITSIVFNTKNLPASLYKALGGFASNGINLTRLESFLLTEILNSFLF